MISPKKIPEPMIKSALVFVDWLDRYSDLNDAIGLASAALMDL